MKKKLTLDESKERTFRLMKTLNENFVSPVVEQTANTQQLERFLSDLGYNQMYYQYKNNLPQLERVFSRLLRGRNLSTFQRLLHPAPTPAEKTAERQRQKDDLANQDFATKKLEYEDMVSQLQKLEPTKLIEKYMEVFNIPSEKQMELYDELLTPKEYTHPDFPEAGDVKLDSFDEKSEEWVEKIATKLMYGEEKPF
jgi:hypothetical protein